LEDARQSLLRDDTWMRHNLNNMYGRIQKVTSYKRSLSLVVKEPILVV